MKKIIFYDPDYYDLHEFVNNKAGHEEDICVQGDTILHFINGDKYYSIVRNKYRQNDLTKVNWFTKLKRFLVYLFSPNFEETKK